MFSTPTNSYTAKPCSNPLNSHVASGLRRCLAKSFAGFTWDEFRPPPMGRAGTTRTVGESVRRFPWDKLSAGWSLWGAATHVPNKLASNTLLLWIEHSTSALPKVWTKLTTVVWEIGVGNLVRKSLELLL